MNYELKPLLRERLKLLMPDTKDFEKFLEVIKQHPVNSIRCNKLKIQPNELLKRLKSKGWVVDQPFKSYPEIMIIEGKYARSQTNEINCDKDNIKKNSSHIKDNNEKLSNNKVSYINTEYKSASDNERELVDLGPGEIGRALEHLLGYYYVQEIASMLPVLALNPKPNEKILDLCAAPGSKTTQIASEMNNSGLLIANDVSIGRISILAANLERCGVSNAIITRKQGFDLCKKLKQIKEVEGKGTLMPYLFDKILLDTPCSGEGTLRSSQATYKMWNIQSVKNLSRIQKSLFASAIELLKPKGEIVYSTCTHSPEENEEVIDFILKKFDNVKIESINLPLKCREGLTNWENKDYDKSIEKSCRIYPQDNNTEGFFIAKLRKIK